MCFSTYLRAIIKESLMKKSTLRRVIKSGIINFFRNGLVSLATVLVMSLSLLMLASVVMGSIFLNTFIQTLQEKVDVNVYFKKTTAENAILDLQNRLRERHEVKEVVYVSREDALKRFLERHKNEELITRSIEVVEENPFSASLEISATDPSKYNAIATFLESQAYQEIIDIDSRGDQKITYRQNQEVIDKLSRILAGTRTIGVGIGIVLALIAVIVAYNTVRLAIYNSRDELAVMQLVGASSWFIRGPFLIEGLVHGLIATVFTLGVMYPTFWWLGARTENSFGGLSVFAYFMDNLFQIFLVIFFSGLMLGVLSSYLAIRRYLKV